MAHLNNSELSQIINQVSRKYAPWFSTMTVEDLQQELWIWMLEKQPEDKAWAYTQCKNRSLDLYRKARRGDGVISMGAKMGDEAEEYIYQNEFLNWRPETSFESASIRDMVDRLPDRERRFVIAKGYLEGGMEEFEDMYNEMVEELSEQAKAQLDTDKQHTDDIIIKVFVGIKTGSNAGSARVLKNNVRTMLDSLVHEA